MSIDLALSLLLSWRVCLLIGGRGIIVIRLRIIYCRILLRSSIILVLPLRERGLIICLLCFTKIGQGITQVMIMLSIMWVSDLMLICFHGSIFRSWVRL